jgi:hypothetical protein
LQNPLALKIGLTGQERPPAGVTEEKLDEGIRTALKVGDVHQVQRRALSHQSPGGQDAATGVPIHVAIDVVHGLVERQEIQRNDIGPVESAEFPGQVAVQVAIVEVVGTAD